MTLAAALDWMEHASSSPEAESLAVVARKELRTTLTEALKPHVPWIHPGDESELTPEETHEAALQAADDALKALGLCPVCGGSLGHDYKGCDSCASSFAEACRPKDEHESKGKGLNDG